MTVAIPTILRDFHTTLPSIGMVFVLPIFLQGAKHLSAETNGP